MSVIGRIVSLVIDGGGHMGVDDSWLGDHSVSLWGIVWLVYLATLGAEWRLHARHLGDLRAAGAHVSYPIMLRIFYRMPFWGGGLGYLEYLFGPRMLDGLGVRWTMFVGASCLGLGLVLRYSSIRELGTFWTRYLARLEGMVRLRTGPYRYLPHPEAVGRIVEAFGLVIFLGSALSALVTVVAMIGCLIKVVPEEEGHFALKDAAT